MCSVGPWYISPVAPLTEHINDGRISVFDVDDDVCQQEKALSVSSFRCFNTVAYYGSEY